jgi:hypothetical protein
LSASPSAAAPHADTAVDLGAVVAPVMQLDAMNLLTLFYVAVFPSTLPICASIAACS